MNYEDRGAARRGAKAIEEITSHTERYFAPPQGDDGAVSDLLTDLRHYCQKHKIDFDSCLRMSESHYEAEKLKRFPKEP
jgi:hypothetical protein